ncbi:MAG: hypothetical protein R3C28_01480 [Pirellulaceae bacterium]
MLRCTPMGICSWDFHVSGEQHQGSLEFNWLGEQGVLTVNGDRFDVHKHGLASGHWTLDQSELQVASAQKSSALARTFELDNGDTDLVLQAVSPFGRAFELKSNNQVVAAINPVHAFTRRATIEQIDPNTDIRITCFAFWLVVLMWRRANNS